MAEYTELIKALRCCGDEGCHKCPYQKHIHEKFCWVIAMKDAAAAIETLQAEVKELKRVNLEIFEDLPKWGEWYTELYDGDKKYQCSNCLTHWDVETRYCPRCGAKMEVQE